MNRDFDIEEKDNDVFIASENLKMVKDFRSLPKNIFIKTYNVSEAVYDKNYIMAIEWAAIAPENKKRFFEKYNISDKQKIILPMNVAVLLTDMEDANLDFLIPFEFSKVYAIMENSVENSPVTMFSSLKEAQKFLNEYNKSNNGRPLYRSKPEEVSLFLANRDNKKLSLASLSNNEIYIVQKADVNGTILGAFLDKMFANLVIKAGEIENDKNLYLSKADKVMLDRGFENKEKMVENLKDPMKEDKQKTNGQLVR